MNKIPLVILSMLLTAGVGHAAVLDEDFEDIAGANPTGAITIIPTAIIATSYIKVVGSTPMGTGNGLAMYDNDSQNLGLEYNFTSQSAIRADLAFSPTAGGSSTAYMTFGMGRYNTSASQQLSATLRRFSEMRFYGDGDLRFYFNGAFVDYNDLVADSANVLTWFLNDYDSQSVSYTVGTTTHVLPANSVAFWVNDTLILNGLAEYGALDLADATLTGTVGTSEGNLGRIGFSDSGVTGMDYLFDNLVVTTLAIPEPSTLGMLVFGSLILLVVRRWRMG